jgi:hypothetical protein
MPEVGRKNRPKNGLSIRPEDRKTVFPLFSGEECATGYISSRPTRKLKAVKLSYTYQQTPPNGGLKCPGKIQRAELGIFKRAPTLVNV